MSTFKKFEDIDAWKLAREVTKKFYSISEKSNLKNDYKLWNQINGSSGSIMDNIAEGFERGGNKEFIQFLFIAKGSCGELRSQLYRVKDRRYIYDSEFDSIYSDLMEIQNKVLGLISYLKNSERKGNKFEDPGAEYAME